MKAKFKIGDKVHQTTGHSRLDEYIVKKAYIVNTEVVYDLQGLIGIIGVKEKDLCPINQKPYTKLK